MLQARTYLFCAIRPEVQFLKYTFSTLGFATNAVRITTAILTKTTATIKTILTTITTTTPINT